MHRDTQIGLAMAIVLIGFAAALCFPRDGQVLQPPADLPNAAVLDAEIAARAIRTYAEPQPTTVPPVTPAERTTTAADSSVLTTTAPSPPAGAALEPPPTPQELQSPEPILPDAEAPTTPFDGPLVTAPDATPATQFHVVQPGDTLSGLAQKYLGSVARYPELFEANRDLLDSPDDLRLQMRLKIPARGE